MGILGVIMRPMPLTTSLVAAVVSAILETAIQGAATDPAQYETYTIERKLPPEAHVGMMQPIKGDGFIEISGKSLRLSSVARFRSQQNLIVMPASIQKEEAVVYLFDNYQNVSRVWLLRPGEIKPVPLPAPIPASSPETNFN